MLLLLKMVKLSRMKNLLKFICFASFIIGVSEPIYSQAQGDKSKNWALSGYLKNMQTTYLLHQPSFDLLQENLVHNRLNFKWFPHQNWTIRTEIRNRLVWGQRLKITPNFAQDFQNSNNDFLPLSINLIEANGLVLNTMLDRIYVQYEKGNWTISLGRQRINWGINTLWNPHDIFNAYNFTDFDHEERPGSDALRIQYYTGVLSSLEFAVKMTDTLSNTTAGFLWKTNKWNYDFQLLAGIFEEHITLGAGWAGNLKNLGFKGETAYFGALNQNSPTLSVTISADYIFKNKLYWSGGFLYNSSGNLRNAGSLLSFRLSARNLYPYRFAISNLLQYPLRDNLNIGVNIIYSPGPEHASFISPIFTYSIKDNWDLDLTGQVSIQMANQQLISPLQAFFLRLKWSF